MSPKKKQRAPVTRARVMAAALRLADEGGPASVSMRKVAAALGVEAMSLYHHVANKAEILDGMIDAVFEEIVLPAGGPDWKDELRTRSCSLRDALNCHPWAVGLMDSRRSPGPATLRHHDAVLGCFRGAGFSLAATARAVGVLDSFVYGFVLQEQSLPFDNADELAEVGADLLQAMPADELPHLAEMVTEHALQPGYAFANEFVAGLDLVLDALAALRDGGAD